MAAGEPGIMFEAPVAEGCRQLQHWSLCWSSRMLLCHGTYSPIAAGNLSTVSMYMALQPCRHAAVRPTDACVLCCAVALTKHGVGHRPQAQHIQQVSLLQTSLVSKAHALRKCSCMGSHSTAQQGM